MAQWNRYGIIAAAVGVHRLFDTPQHPQYLAIVYPSVFGIVPGYRGVLAWGSTESLGPGGTPRECIFQETVIWYPSQQQVVDPNQECQFAYYVVGSKSTDIGKVVELWGYY